MSCSTLFAQTVKKGTLFASAIAGSLLLSSALPAPEMPVPSTLMPASTLMQVPDSKALTTNSTATEIAENRFVILALALGGCVVLCLVVNALVDGKQPWSTRRATGANRRSPTRPNEINFNQANSSLRHKLLRLLNGDQAAAQRLFKLATLKYPGETPNWYVEKVIYDLERDRRRI
ncbi:hypothetical protein H6G89_04635 [Oscillatoria sp. FACHB-1407]|uniref:hypothetical protein n=1 Tax=Oscillatoria sp. FACHB-1407 TaxID=2692847 RepID=UPI00168486BF|nr:hypothetical protein [Oscillatoria sp. FACHB-1407]MBD2460324.1 hypothetical protein [Oscillatoria sp. FACHB-1407]